MSAVVDLITDVFEAVITITLTITLIGPVLSLISEDFKDWYLGELADIMSLFGINDEDVVETSLSDQRLLTDEEVSNILTKIALVHETTQQDIIDLMSLYTSKTRANMNQFFDYGKATYSYGLPTATLRAAVVPEEEVINQIKLEYGVTNVFLDYTAIRVPTKEEHVYYKLDELYEYLPYTNKLMYLGKEYTLKFIDYNYTTNKYDCTVFRAGTQITETTITITPYTEAYVAYDNTTQYFVGDHVMYSGVAYKCIADSLGNLPTDAMYWTAVDYDNKNTNIKVSVILAEETIVVSDTSTDELIIAGSEVDSYSSVSVAVEYGSTVIAVTAFSPVIHIIVKWYETDNSMWRSWTYQLGSGNAILDSSQRYLGELDLLPIVELRNSKVNVNSDPTSELYKQSKEMLHMVGVDIDVMTDSIMQSPSINELEDAYIYFGVSLKDSSPTIAKMIYNSVEFMFYDNNLQSNAGAYNFRVTEGKYNLAVAWRDQTRTIITGTIGIVGTHQMTTSGNTLIIRKQENATQYVEYRLIDMGSTTFIKRGAYAGVVAHTLQNNDLIFPVSFFMLTQLSPLEQVEVFCKALRLQTYAISITHLEWYQTSAFMDLIQIVIAVVGVVLTIASLPAGGSGGAAWLTWAAGMLQALAIGVGVTLALKYIMESGAPDWLKMLAAVAAIAGAAYYGGTSGTNVSFNTAEALTSGVTMFAKTASMMVNVKYEDLMEQVNQFNAVYKQKAESLEAKLEQAKSYMAMSDVIDIYKSKGVTSYIEGYDLRMYRAIEQQYDWDRAKGGLFYDNAFEVSNMCKVGILS